MGRDIDVRRPRTRLRNPLALAPFASLLGDVWGADRWFDDLLSPTISDVDIGQTVAPACDVEETDSHYLLCVDMPGIPKEDIRVDASGNQLTISGERRETQGTEGARYRSERYASFRRSFTLPAGVDPEKIEANYENGVLQVAVPKTEAAKARRIEIGTAPRAEKLAKPIESKESKQEQEKEKAA